MQNNPLETKRAHRDKVGVKAATAAEKKIGTRSLLQHTCPPPALKFARLSSPFLGNKLLFEEEEEEEEGGKKLQYILSIPAEVPFCYLFSRSPDRMKRRRDYYYYHYYLK